MAFDAKSLIRQLSAPAMNALEIGVQAGATREHAEIDLGHFLYGCLQVEQTDVRHALGLSGRLDAAERALAAALAAERKSPGKRPVFATGLLSAIHAADQRNASVATNVATRAKVRSGHVLHELLANPSKYAVGALVSGLFGGPPPRTLDECLRGEEESSRPTSAPTAARRSAARVTVTHVVELGERLVDIARTYACDAEDVALDNNIALDFPIEPGQRLVVRPLAAVLAALRAPDAPKA
ncbi:Hypothetical protein A7982_01499 [Minicystis rosea]|nr:Hypothetical protein A7982_01499 [Minicystis rosea]